MLDWRTFTCIKCGKRFTKAVGGVVMCPQQMQLEIRPVCDKCKLSAIAGIFK